EEETRSIPKLDHVHNLTKVDAIASTCKDQGNNEYYTCPDCSKVFKDAEGTTETTVEEETLPLVDHTWGEPAVVDATCTADGSKTYKCTGCEVGEKVEPITKLGHDFEAYTETKAPTCTEDGEETATCSRGGETDTKVIAKLGHDFGEAVETTPATCTTPGEKTGTCSRCGETTTEEIAALGHDFEAYTETKAPTCTEDGEETATCSRCGETDTKVIAKLGHDFGEAVETTPATCTTPGEKTGTCSRCGETTIEAIPALGHDWGEWATTVEPTTESKGEERRDCSRCDAYETRELEKLESDSGFLKQWYTAMLALMNRTFKIDAEAGFGGEIDPEGILKVKTGKNVTYTITPDEGYEIEAVYVDGEDIGAVEEYTFKNVKKDHTITAEFAAIEDEEDAVIDEAIDEEESLYDDVDSDDWFYDDVAFVTENGLMNGVGGDLFAPELNTTRAMIVTILWRLEGEAEAESAGFTDVAADMWYTEAIDWAAANGIVLGYGDGTFGPEINITREQVMAILNRYAAFKGWDDGIAVTMIPQYNCSVWAENNVNWADMNGILADLGVDVYDMTAEADRAEIAAYFTRFCLNVAE
ncbi:MAG: S-layer homology domain-containing protein, partial [Kiritimatiellae bacterium]|nr:S-layer homology domain-containing protein [Kiritimatiellia bacterium]